MTTVAQLIQDAYRESNLIPIGTTPTPAEEAEALRLLERIRLSVLGNEAGDPLEPYPLGNTNIQAPSGFPFEPWSLNGEWYVPLNKRLMLNLNMPMTVRLHPQPEDGARFAYRDLSLNLSTYPLTIEGNGRLINGATQLVVNTDGEAKEFFYRDDLGQWVEVPASLTTTDNWFYPPEFDDMFTTMLALRLNPRNGQLLTQEVTSALNRSVRQFKARYTQTIATRSELGLLRLTNDADRYTTLYADPTDLFNSGWPVAW